MVETAAQRDMDVRDVARVFYDIGDKLSMRWLREHIDQLPVDGQWHAHARANLRDELYAQHRNLAGRILDAYPGSANPVSSWIESNTEYVERVLLMLTDMRDQPQMDYATVSVAVRSLDHLMQATE